MLFVSHYLKKIIIPYRLDGVFINLLILLPRVISGVLLTVMYTPENIGTPWSPEHLDLDFFEINPEFVKRVADFGPPFDMMPYVFSWSAIITMGLGGIFLTIGLNTRMTSFFIVMTMFITILFREWDSSWNILATFIFFCIGLFYQGFGSGKYGLDYYISKRFF